jgi:hypothetical protein
MVLGMEEPDPVAESVVSADGNEVIDAEPVEVLEDFRGQVVRLGGILVMKVFGDAVSLDLAGIGPRGMKERAAGTAGTVDDFFGKDLEIIAVVVVLFPDDIDEAGPTAFESNDRIALAQGAESYGSDRGIKPRDIASASKDPYYLLATICHISWSLKRYEC